MSSGKTDGIFEGLSNVLLRAIPGVGTLGSSVLAKFVPWFGWLVYVGFVDNLNTPVIGALTGDEYRALASESVRQSIVGLLRTPTSFALTLLLLFLVTVHVGVKPPEKPPQKPTTGTVRRLKWWSGYFKHLYFSYYYPITAGVFVCLFALLVMLSSRWVAVAVLLTSAVTIPLFSFRHGYQGKDNWHAVSYVALLLVLVLVMVAYPYRFGNAAYNPVFVWLVPEQAGDLSALRMRIEPPAPGFNVTLSCQRGKWLIELAGVSDVKAIRRESYGSLTELPWYCEGNNISPIDYSSP